MITLSHPTGNANVREAIKALDSARLLEKFYTCIAWDEKSHLSKIIPKRISRELLRRSFLDIDMSLIQTHSSRELFRLILGKSFLGRQSRLTRIFFSVDSVYQSLDRYTANSLKFHQNLKGVYAYEDGALETFKEAERLGIHRFYELPIGYWRSAQSIFKEEAEIKPEWASTIPGLKDKQKKLNRKKHELELSSSIIVASNFVRKTIIDNGFRDKKIYVIPYGMPQPIESKKINKNSPLKVLFIGSLSQRKGISYLFESTSRLKGLVEVTVVGRMIDRYCIPLNRALEHCTWIETLPHDKILNLMSESDVFVFPSLFEGFGLVITEALSQGVPVITTHNTAGPDIILNGKNGFLVNIRDTEKITEYLEILALDRDLLEAMSTNARLSAKQHPWENYRQQLQEAIREEMACK